MGMSDVMSPSRAAFQEWFEMESYPFEHSNWFKRDEFGDYEIPSIDESWDGWQAGVAWNNRLVDLCQELIGYLEAVEESDSGRGFSPTQITSCRCMVLDRLGKIIPEIKSICENSKVRSSNLAKINS
jgi:hypothetical protein